MRLTPLDIRKQEFTRGFRGYDPEEVQAFLQMISAQWEELVDEQRRLAEKLRDLEIKIGHYEKVEEALQEALQTARESSRKALENAEHKARLIVQEAEARGEEIRREAEQERHQIKRDAAKLSGRRNEIVARLRAFLLSEMELLARFEGDDPIGFIKLLPAEEHRVQRLAERALPPASAAPEDEPAPPRAARAADDAPPASPEPPPRRNAPEPRPEPAAEPRPSPAAPRAEEPPRPPRVTWQNSPAAGEDDGPEPYDPLTDRPAVRAAEAGGGRVPESRYAPLPPEDRFAPPELDEPEPEPPAEAAGPPPAREEVKHGPGWTARSVVVPPKAPPRPSPEGGTERVAASDEEIDKIRRILNDLD